MSTLFEILIQGVNVILNLINEMSCNNIPLHDSYEVNVSLNAYYIGQRLYLQI